MRPSLLLKIKQMSDAQLYDAIYTDELTGIANRRAFGAVPYGNVAIVDLDSLKYINDCYGYRAGDMHLCELAKGLAATFGEWSAFRIAGDEFAVTGACAAAMEDKLKELNTRLVGFTYGIGTNLEEANISLKSNKIRRLESGERAERGLRPMWLK